jgi:hypothetical protein
MLQNKMKLNIIGRQVFSRIMIEEIIHYNDKVAYIKI